MAALLGPHGERSVFIDWFPGSGLACYGHCREDISDWVYLLRFALGSLAENTWPDVH
jgi:hypothetical protein